MVKYAYCDVFKTMYLKNIVGLFESINSFTIDWITDY